MTSRCFLSVVAAGVALLCVSCVPDGTSASPRRPPKLTFAETTHAVGRVEAGRSVIYAYPFRNPGGLDLSIDNVRAGCSCAVALPQPRVIPPGAEGRIEVTYDTTHEHGPQRRTITVYSNDPVQPVTTLTLVADIDAVVAAEPPQLYIGHVHRGEPAATAARLVIPEGTAVGPAETTGTVLDAGISGFAAQRTPAMLRVAIKPHAPLGRFKESVLIHTQNPRQPLLTIPVVGIVEPAVTAPTEKH